METNATRTFNWRVKTIKIYTQLELRQLELEVSPSQDGDTSSLNHGFFNKSIRKHNLFIVEQSVKMEKFDHRTSCTFSDFNLSLEQFYKVNFCRRTLQKRIVRKMTLQLFFSQIHMYQDCLLLFIKILNTFISPIICNLQIFV